MDKNKIIIIVVSIIVAVAIIIGTIAIIMLNNSDTTTNSSQDMTESSANQQTILNMDGSDESQNSNQNSTNSGSKSDNSQNNPSVSSDGNANKLNELNKVYTNRPEKNVAAYPIVNEFFSPNYQQKIFKDSKSGKELRYCLYLPENYSKNKKYPVLLFLHGMGSVGTDYVGATNAIKPAFTDNADILKTAIIVAPQTSDAGGFWPIGNDQKGWGAVAMRLLLDVEKNYSCDTNRIYITGNSMGGHGTWNLLETYGDHFAAGAPMCGWSDNVDNASKLKDIPIWIYHGDSDPTVPVTSSRSIYNAIKSAGGTKVKYTELSGVQHDCWTQAYQNRELWSWMFSKNKATNKSGKYEIIPYIKITDHNGNTIITEKDTSLISFVEVANEDCIELTLTDNGAKKLETAYKNSSGKTFYVYYGNKMIMSFTAYKGSVNKKFYIAGVFTSYDYYEYISRIKV